MMAGSLSLASSLNNEGGLTIGNDFWLTFSFSRLGLLLVLTLSQFMTIWIERLLSLRSLDNLRHSFDFILKVCAIIQCDNLVFSVTLLKYSMIEFRLSHVLNATGRWGLFIQETTWRYTSRWMLGWKSQVRCLNCLLLNSVVVVLWNLVYWRFFLILFISLSWSCKFLTWIFRLSIIIILRSLILFVGTH